MKLNLAATAVSVCVTSCLGFYQADHGRWLSRDPIAEAGGVNVYGFLQNNPIQSVDQWGLLNREQLDWLAHQWDPSWPGVDAASRQDIQSAMPTIRQNLQTLSSGSFTGSEWSQSYSDDKALQKLLDSGMLAGFPGKAYDKCWDCKKIKTWMDQARQVHNSPKVTDALFLAWVMKESSWVSTASAYGWSSGKSTATGLTQITRSTWQLPGMQQGLPKTLQSGWEKVTTDPALSLAAGMWALDRHPGKTIYDQLAAYKGTGGVQYAQKVRSGEQLVRSSLAGKSLDQLSPSECQELMTKLDNLVQ